MIKAEAKHKMYYIFPKKEISANEALAEVAIALHEKPSKFEVLDAKLVGENKYEIGTKGKHIAVTRRKKNDIV